jgi:hypothetical protein
MKFSLIPQFTQKANYSVDVTWDYLEDWLEHINEKGLMTLDLDPDFQRAHVWTTDKQIKYVEFVLRGGQSSRDLYFNHPNWMGSFKGKLELVDGKQRLEAVRSFLKGNIPAFETHYHDYEDKLPWDASFKIHINNLKTRKEVLQWYLDLNSGGVIHTEEELNKVKMLLEQEK